jgi:EAL domain-containing protein (putative c-di-GMP-specific phosphodiesterase class I)
MPVDELEIDKGFVLQRDRDDHDDAIVEAAITLADRLALTITADGVETRESWQRLHDLGCDHEQGFLISRPLPAAEVVAWHRARPSQANTLHTSGAGR